MTALRSVYSVDEFAAEVLDGKRTPAWVRQECRRRRIATVGRRPWLIKGSEAIRFRGELPASCQPQPILP